jgi:hypothetical protein
MFKTIRLEDKTKQSIRLKIISGISVRRGIHKTFWEREYISDPGDFGRGIYYDTNYHRAKTYGEVTKSVLKLTNPIVLSSSEAYEIAEKFQTVRLNDDWYTKNNSQDSMRARLSNAKKMTEFLLNQGYDGLAAVNIKMGSIEIVDYRPYIEG